jgi:hypothetical protein
MKNHSAKALINPIRYVFLLGLSIARSNIETGEILQRCQIGRINVFSKAVPSGSDFLQGRGKFSLSEVFSHI